VYLYLSRTVRDIVIFYIDNHVIITIIIISTVTIPPKEL